MSTFDAAQESLMRPGTVGVIPTDTIYGVVARAADQEAVDRLYQLKKREHKPGTIVAANIEQLVNLGIKRRYLKAVEHLWPGPLSVEIPNTIDYLNQSTGRQAFRLPNDRVLTQLLLIVGPLLTTSANEPGKPTANTVDDAQLYFGESVDFYVDGGDLSGRLPSTIIGYRNFRVGFGSSVRP